MKNKTKRLSLADQYLNIESERRRVGFLFLNSSIKYKEGQNIWVYSRKDIKNNTIPKGWQHGDVYLDEMPEEVIFKDGSVWGYAPERHAYDREEMTNRMLAFSNSQIDTTTSPRDKGRIRHESKLRAEFYSKIEKQLGWGEVARDTLLQHESFFTAATRKKCWNAMIDNYDMPNDCRSQWKVQ